jgi:hypothetical protein
VCSRANERNGAPEAEHASTALCVEGCI